MAVEQELSHQGDIRRLMPCGCDSARAWGAWQERQARHGEEEWKKEKESKRAAFSFA
jgi:hypothetical protein